MAVVDVIRDGETIFVFHDDYCKDTSPEEAQKAMKRIADMALPFVRAAAEKERDEKTAEAGKMDTFV